MRRLRSPPRAQPDRASDRAWLASGSSPRRPCSSSAQRANAERNAIDPFATLLLDWRHPPPDLGGFDLLIAADVLYERRNADALATLIPRLAAPDGRVLLADPGRTYLEHFRDLMRGAGWRVEESGRRSEPVPETGREVTVRLYSLWRGLPPVIGPRRSCRRS